MSDYVFSRFRFQYKDVTLHVVAFSFMKVSPWDLLPHTFVYVWPSRTHRRRTSRFRKFNVIKGREYTNEKNVVAITGDIPRIARVRSKPGHNGRGRRAAARFHRYRIPFYDLCPRPWSRVRLSSRRVRVIVVGKQRGFGASRVDDGAAARTRPFRGRPRSRTPQLADVEGDRW